jgi:hypothetical protein
LSESKEESQSQEANKETFPSCSECSWKKEQLEGISPCEYCIRNPETVSKRWKGPRELSLKGIRMKVPRDMYISEEMLEFFKIILTTYSKENAILRAMLERSKVKEPVYPPIWEHPYWRVTGHDDRVFQTSWLSYAVEEKIRTIPFEIWKQELIHSRVLMEISPKHSSMLLSEDL